MTTLSPAAQAVINAARLAYWDADVTRPESSHQIAAAVLRAAADQVVPYENKPAESSWQVGFLDAWAQIRRELLAIAAELEGQP